MKSPYIINVWVGTHFKSRIQERFHIDEKNIIPTLNSNLKEAYILKNFYTLFFPEIGIKIPIVDKLNSEGNYFAKTIQFTLFKEHFFKKRKHMINVVWYDI